MAYAVSQNFKDKIKDETVPKSCLLISTKSDLFFSTSDFTDSGVVFNQYFNTSDDLTFGDCPSDTLSFSVVANGGLKAYPFGDAQTYIGVQTATESFAMPTGYNGYISISGTVYSAREDGFYKGNTKLVDGEFFSVISDGTYVWGHGAPGTYKHEIGTSTASKVSLITFMQRKLASGLSAVFASNTATVWTDGEKQTWEYVPMGLYRVERPKSTVGQTVNIQDAYDRMSLFDKDASEFLSGLTYPKTLSQIYIALCTFVGVSYVSSTFTYSTESYASSPFPDSACSCRDILSWIAERARSVAHFNRVGVLDLAWCGSVDAEQLTPDQVQADGFVVSEYITEPVDSVLLKSTDGSSLSFGSTFNNPYQIFGNPFITTISSSDLDAYKAIPTYVPVELGVFECDPSIDLGDLVGTLGVSKKYVSFADAMGVALTDRYGVVFAEEADGAFSFPLMNREVQFIGAIRAVYTATGGKYRECDEDNTAYNALISVNETQLGNEIDDYDRSLDQAEIMAKLTNDGEEQGIYLYNGKIYINAEYINAHTISADKIKGSITNGSWGIDFTNGTMSIGTLAVGSITGSISNGGWGINFTNGTMSIGTLAVGSITGSITNGGWGINFTNGTMSIGTLAVGSITGNISNGNWKIDFTNGTFSIGNISANNINAGTITGIEINNGSGTFKVTPAGAVTASNLSVTGGSISVSRNDGADTSQANSAYLKLKNTANNYTSLFFGGSLDLRSAENIGANVRSMHITPASIISTLWAGASAGSPQFLLQDSGLAFQTSGSGTVLYPNTGTSEYYGNSSDGCVRFNQTGVQIAWKRVTWTVAITTAWGSGVYESTTYCSLGNWKKAFSATPAVAYGCHSSGGRTAWVASGDANATTSLTKTSAGYVFLERGGSTLASTTWYVMVVAVGTYWGT